ncbi:ferritin-like domain-containing protein [Rhodoligotrophos defluvii]|uniref:YciE/YciF ferroxidase family protein n=1 Tax=Rhodoligotrophos defluvii TaxID=2561934 RepID=UPI0010C9B633|nr:DUF892 family protein [Rhodoligotrophos defluvii]
MNITSLKDMYIAELQEARSFESMLKGALGEMAERASDPNLQKAFRDHAAATREHQRMVEAVLGSHSADTTAHTDQGLEALTIETKKMAAMTAKGPLRDAAMIASAQRIEHYEIAVYGTLAAYAKALSLDSDREILSAILEEEKDTDLVLSDLAEGVITPTAVELESR